MKRRILTVSLALVMALSFAACAEGEEAGLLSAQEIVDGVIEAQKNIKTAQYDIDMTMDMNVEAEGEVFDMTGEMDMSYALDLEEREMAADMTMDMQMAGEMGIEMGMEMYIIDDMMYMMMDVPEMEPTWIKSEMPEGIWDAMNQLESYVELLHTTQVRIAGSESVSGVDCYVLEVTPDAEQLWQLAMQQAEITGEEMMPDIAEDVLKEVLRDSSLKYWVAKDTYFLAKAEMALDMELNPEDLGMPEEEGEMTMDMFMTMLAYNYNQPVSIVLPPEAEEAEEFPMLMP